MAYQKQSTDQQITPDVFSQVELQPEQTNTNVGGFTANDDGLYSGDLSIESSRQRFRLGVGDDVIMADALDQSYRLWVGNVTPSLAPFRVTKKGAVTATSITVNQQFPAGENITTGDAVAAGYFQSDGGLKLDAKDKNHSATTGLVAPLTIGNNSNRIVIAVIGVNNTTISNVQFGGVAMTLIDSVSNGVTLVNAYYLVAPATGSQNLTATIGSAVNFTTYFIYSYYNASQTSQPSSHNTGTATANSGSVSITPAERGDIVFFFVSCALTGPGSLSTITGAPVDQQLEQAIGGINSGCGTNGTALSLSAQTPGFTAASNPAMAFGAFTIKPASAITFGYVVKASAAAATTYTIPTDTAYRQLAFLGFATATATTGSQVPVVTSGVIMDQLTGLTPFGQYYLSDTAGQISTTPGTNSRKVGIATTTSSLTITNIW